MIDTLSVVVATLLGVTGAPILYTIRIPDERTVQLLLVEEGTVLLTARVAADGNISYHLESANAAIEFTDQEVADGVASRDLPEVLGREAEELRVAWGSGLPFSIESQELLFVYERIRNPNAWILADASGAPVFAPELSPAGGPGSTPLSPPRDDHPDGSPIHAVRYAKDLITAKKGRAFSDAGLVDIGGATVSRVLDNPATFNMLLATAMEAPSGIAFLKDTDLRFKTFDIDGNAALGLSFDWVKREPFSITTATDDEGRELPSVSGFGYDMAVRGNAAFDRAVNPSDFLTTRLALEYFRSWGGVKTEEFSVEEQTRLNALAGELADYEDTEALFASQEWAELRTAATRTFTNQYSYGIAADLGYETNQAFTQENFTIGARGTFDVKAWDPDSSLARANVFDYPAAGLRFLTGHTEQFRPLGTAIPSLLIAYEHVEPNGNTPRAVVGDDSSYLRLRLELAYKTPVGRLGDQIYSLVAGYHRLAETNASDAIRAAGLDDYDYFSLALEGASGLYISYGNGSRPFDLGDDEFVELGWKLDF